MPAVLSSLLPREGWFAVAGFAGGATAVLAYWLAPAPSATPLCGGQLALAAPGCASSH